MILIYSRHIHKLYFFNCILKASKDFFKLDGTTWEIFDVMRLLVRYLVMSLSFKGRILVIHKIEFIPSTNIILAYFVHQNTVPLLRI